MKRRETLKMLFATALASTCPLSFATTSAKKTNRRILVEAHRGNSAFAPENTIEAVEEAIAIGVDRVEIDLHLSGDNQLIVIHDETVDRTTNGSGKVSLMPYQEIARLDAGSWKSDKYKNSKVPLLQEILELCKAKTMINIDLKSAEAVPIMVKAINDMNMADSIVLTGKIPHCTEAIRQAGGKLTMFYENSSDFDQLLSNGEILQAIKTAICEAREYYLPGFLFKADWITPEVVYMAHLHGLAVNVWDVNSEETLQKMIEAGADSIMTDFPEKMITYLKKR